MNYLTKKHIHIYIFYGSQTGYAESVAQELKKQIVRKVKPIHLDIDMLNNFFEYDIVNQPGDSFTIILLSTTGDGEFPDNAEQFFKRLRKQKPDLHTMEYCLLGFGDSNYNSFCHSSKVLLRMLKRLGATTFIDTQYNDDSTQSTEMIDAWMERVIEYLSNYKHTVWEWFIQSMAG
jgi:sulfite reductase alpha subunit-like flavoprotein